jgi:lipoate-protein ligase A
LLPAPFNTRFGKGTGGRAAFPELLRGQAVTAPPCRLLPFRVADGPANMAADEALLESAAAGTAALRFYSWTAATLSLGYFQPSGPSRSDPLLAGLPWVRRPTGGEAIVHHHELTYALALPPGRPWQAPGESWLTRLHAVIARALGKMGVVVHANPPGEERKLGAVLCFLHHTPGDLLIGPNKVVGSAQRKGRGALLQHGSILLQTSPFAPALPGIAELSGRRLQPADVADAVALELAQDTGWRLEPGDWTDEERRRSAELAAAKYATARWNARR